MGAEPATAPAGAGPSDHFAAIVEWSDDAIITKDRDAVITAWNPAAERIYGYTPEEAIGQPISMLIPPHRAGEERRILDQILKGQRVDHYETERITKGGRTLVVSLTVSPLRDEEGTITGASVIARDITSRQRSRELADRLHRVTAALSRELTPDRVVDVVLEQVTQGLGAVAGALGVIEDDEIVLVGNIGHSEAGLADWHRFPLDLDVPMTAVVRSGEGLYLTDPEELVERFPVFADAAIRHPSLAVLPLVSAGWVFGTISLSFDTRRDFDLEERAFLFAATQQAAHALARARSYEEKQSEAEGQRFLAEAGELLSESLDPEAALQRLAQLAVGRVADWCGVELREDDGELRSVAVAHADPEKVRPAQELRERYPVDPNSETGAPNVIRTGRSELYREVPDELLVEGAKNAEHLRLLRRLGLSSAMIVPLKARGRVFGAITLVASDPDRHYDEDDLALVEDLARTAALAVDNARLYRREHDAAIMLQRALLPQTLPDVPGLRFEARYHPAAPGSEVGGDWFEVVALNDGAVALTIGDVAGRGIRAAAVMGQIRPALGAYVRDGHGPKAAVERIHRLMLEFPRSEMITLFHLRCEAGGERARFVRAGHPPALLRLPGGEVRELTGHGMPPLGIFPGMRAVENETELPPGSMLLLYTDGLIERRQVDLAASVERLKRTLSEAPGDIAEVLDWVEAKLEIEGVGDDVALLGMAVDGS
jgi:PAS domain S-box-containing protein